MKQGKEVCVSGVQLSNFKAIKHSYILSAGLGGGGNRRTVDGEDDGEDGLMVFDVQISTMDPITMREMTDPVKSSKCGHAYEKSSMLEILKNKPTTK